MTTVVIPRKIEKELKNTSRKLGITAADFLVNATLYYSKSLRDKIELKNELNMWENVSSKDFLKFEKGI